MKDEETDRFIQPQFPISNKSNLDVDPFASNEEVENDKTCHRQHMISIKDFIHSHFYFQTRAKFILEPLWYPVLVHLYYLCTCTYQPWGHPMCKSCDHTKMCLVLMYDDAEGK